jgi:hypothetical protein
MGICVSRSKGGNAAARPVRPSNSCRPQESLIPIPEPRVDQDGMLVFGEEHDLDSQALEHGLELMAKYIHQQDRELTVPIIGGAVNTLLLRNRRTTHDIDFFRTNIDNNQRRLLGQAASYAERQSLSPLGASWFNNENEVTLYDLDVHRKVTREALAQNEIVFQTKGLKVIASPWEFAFCAKVSRFARGRRRGARPYDLADAVSYLRRYIQRRRGRPVSTREIKAWAEAYSINTDCMALREAATEYRRFYGSDGIVNVPENLDW